MPIGHTADAWAYLDEIGVTWAGEASVTELKASISVKVVLKVKEVRRGYVVIARKDVGGKKGVEIPLVRTDTKPEANSLVRTLRRELNGLGNVVYRYTSASNVMPF